jgi:single-stranded DNA-binding protein
MAMETTGRLHVIFETKQVSERFSKREFVVELTDNPKYPQTVLFQLTGDRVTQLDGLSVGDHVAIEFSLRGRQWQSPTGEVKYFNSLDVWRLEPRGANAGAGNGNGNGNARRTNGGGGYPRDDRNAPTYDDPRPSDIGRSRDDDLPF